MQYFDNFNVDENKNPETKLSDLERNTIDNIISVVETLIIKAKEVTTYGEIYKIVTKVEKFMEEVEDSLEGTVLEKSPEVLTDPEKVEASAKVESVTESMKSMLLEQMKKSFYHDTMNPTTKWGSYIGGTPGGSKPHTKMDPVAKKTFKSELKKPKYRQ